MDPNAHQHQAEQQSIPIDFNYLFERIKAVLFDPAGVWSTIKAENLSIQDMYVKYLLVLIGAGCLAQYLGMVVVGADLGFGTTFRWGIFSGLIYTIVNFVMMSAGVFLGAVIIQALAPNFQASVSMPGALQLLGFSMTAALVCGLFSIIPLLGVIGIVGLVYSLYTYYQGLTPMTGVPHEKRGPFFGISIVSIFVAMFLLMWIGGIFQPTAPVPDFSDLQRTIQDFSRPAP